ncbi:MAG: TonB family protein, partial [Flavobacteriaceae bacterium]|nr:TonB family protein [Flavobacteriaceae bacterium]
LLLLFIPLLISAQKKIEGTVLDFNKEPLPGAAIYNINNNKKTVSNINGDFKIKALIGETLQISYVGFETNTFKVSKLNKVIIEMSADANLKKIVAEAKSLENIPEAKLKLTTINNDFLDCEINDNNCFQEKLDKHILDNFYYPDLGDYFDVQAIVYVNYTIDKEGIVKDINSNAALVGVIFEDVESKNIISKAFEDAASSIIKKLPKLNPNTKEGISVDTKFRTPIMYKLSYLGSYADENLSKLPVVSISNEKIEKALNFLDTNSMSKAITIIENVPLFPGCERVPKSQRRQCFQEQIQKHINRNFQYPEQAQKLGIEGRVFIQFIIGKDGSIGGIRTRGPHQYLEREAYRIISLLPRMTPGIQRGRPVRVPFSITITFRLQ